MRFSLVALMAGAIAFAPSPASAQSTSFDDLAVRLEVGEKLRVEDRSGARTSGRLAGLTADTITLETGEGERRFRRDDVATVAKRGVHSKRGALIGAAVGAALGIPSISGENGDPDAPVLTGLLGAGAGAIVGAFVPRLQTVYRSNGRETSLAPVVTRGGAGISVSWRW
jgi:hypothetical protein